VDFTAETFRPRIGVAFSVDLGDGREIHLELADVEDAPAEAGRAAEAAGLRRPFSIVFRGSLDPLLPQGTYRVQHEEMAPFELFVVPIGQDGSGTRYEAVFG
jgi:hypothetical protein